MAFVQPQMNPPYTQFMNPGFYNQAPQGVGLYTGLAGVQQPPQSPYQQPNMYPQYPTQPAYSQNMNYGSYGNQQQMPFQNQQIPQYQQYGAQMNQQYYQPQPNMSQMQAQNPNFDDAQYFMKNIVTSTTESINDREAFEAFMQRFEQEYMMKNLRGANDRTPSPLRRSQSNPLVSNEYDNFNRSARSRSPSPLIDNRFQNVNGQSMKDYLPTENEKQRVLYTDPHANSQGFLMNDRKNNPLNYQEINQQYPQTYREQSPTRTAKTFYDQVDVRVHNMKNQIYTQPTAQQPQRFNQPDFQGALQGMGGLQDTVGSMRRSLEKYELNPHFSQQQQRSISPNSLAQNFNQQMNINPNQFNRSFAGGIENQYGLPNMASYQRDEQRVRIMQIVNQPQLKTTLSSSNYMRQLREQSLRQIQNWDFVQKDYEEKMRKKQEELNSKDPKKAGAAGGATGSRTYGVYGNINPTISANSYLKM